MVIPMLYLVKIYWWNCSSYFVFLHTIGNKLLTFLSNIFIKLNLSDMETCCKLFNAKMMQSINLQERRFEFEPEFTAKIKGTTIYEVGISY
jgi:hypothetical protein